MKGGCLSRNVNLTIIFKLPPLFGIINLLNKNGNLFNITNYFSIKKKLSTAGNKFSLYNKILKIAIDTNNFLYNRVNIANRY